MIDDAIGKILGMAMAYFVSSLGLFLAYVNYRRRIVKADKVMTPAAWLAVALESDATRVDILDLYGLALLQVVQSGRTGRGGLEPEERLMVDESRLNFGRAIARAPATDPR